LIPKKERPIMSIETLWYTRCPVPTAFSLAVQRGLLDEEFLSDGIAVRSLHSSDDPAVRRSHFTHTQPGSFRHGGHIPPLWARSQGRDVRLIGLSWNEEFQAVLALPESEIRSVADLRGKRLGLPRRLNDPIDFWRASGVRGFRSALETAGLNERDVEFVDVPVERSYVDDARAGTSHAGSLWGSTTMRALQRAEIFALIDGRVDAIFAPGSVGVETAAFLGATVVVDLDREPVRLCRLNNATLLALTVDGDVLTRRPDIVARVLARVIEAAAWARTSPDAARRIVANEVGSPEDVLPIAYRPDFLDHLEPDLSDENLAALAHQQKLLLEHGFLHTRVDLERYVDRAPLAEARRLLAERAGHATLTTAATA
jgi:ABC-type nitrate/sulfonate/bicarbonate transport system substrate-binding protein